MSRRKVEINMKFATYEQMQSLYQKAANIKCFWYNRNQAVRNLKIPAKNGRTPLQAPLK